MQLSLPTAVVALAALVGNVVGETHTVRFNNLCSAGTPIFIENGTLRSTGNPYTSDGSLTNGIAYLQGAGSCGPGGENCTVIETTLANTDDTTNPLGSTTDINLGPPHAFNVAAGFRYSKGCDDTGANCAHEDCPEADVTVECKADDVDLTITFCRDA